MRILVCSFAAKKHGTYLTNFCLLLKVPALHHILDELEIGKLIFRGFVSAAHINAAQARPRTCSNLRSTTRLKRSEYGATPRAGLLVQNTENIGTRWG